MCLWSRRQVSRGLLHSLVKLAWLKLEKGSKACEGGIGHRACKVANLLPPVPSGSLEDFKILHAWHEGLHHDIVSISGFILCFGFVLVFTY